MENSTERKGSSLERQQAANLEDTKSSLDCPAKTVLEWQRQTQDWINSTERQEETRKAPHKQGVGSGVCCTVPTKCDCYHLFFPTRYISNGNCLRASEFTPNKFKLKLFKSLTAHSQWRHSPQVNLVKGL